MKSLEQIVTAVRDGEHPDYEELRYAICALDALCTFDRLALTRLARAERDGMKPTLVTSAVWQLDEHLRRWASAGSKSPKEYVGWNNDPDNAEFIKRRAASKRVMTALVEKADAAPFPHPGHVTAEEMNRPFGPADGSGDGSRATDQQDAP